MRYIEIDKSSGFCFGVVNAIKKVEATLAKGGTLYCLGDIVHNGQEVSRLEAEGLITINHDQYFALENSKVLLRAHGEPPRTYKYAKEAGIQIIDATCPVVLQLQKKIRLKYESIKGKDIQIVLYGKPGHAEIVGLLGQTEDTAIVLESVRDIDKIDFTKGICLFSQTTKSIEGFNQLVELIKERLPDHL
ncbi:MAG: 4-hydroxy-3-methylbut-2-enyl diphosphate reductase, partial [Bacteroidales bacterium]